MPLTFFEIEKRKSWKIGIFFIILIFLYFVIALALFVTFYQFFSMGSLLNKGFLPNPSSLIIFFTFAAVIAFIHFYTSAYSAVRHIRNNIGAMAPDPEDALHMRLIHIMDEIRIVSENKRDIQCAVIPTLSMNALSAVDIKGDAIIAITEGLLSMISRAQLEAVIAHEAYHILSGDCMETTVAASLFGVPSAAVEKICDMSRGRALFSPAFIFTWLLIKLSMGLNMLISRDREYRADAGAVRMTRNPLALAEVLYMLSRNWRGAGFIGKGLEMLCITNASSSRLDESEGWYADLMSTHPPIKKRIKLLLNMTHTSIKELVNMKEADSRVNTSQADRNVFYVMDTRYLWQGPYTFEELVVLPWLSTVTWVSQDGEDMRKASQIPAVNSILKIRLMQEKNILSNYMCPSCNHQLIKISYEKTMIYQCRSCGGSLVENDKLPRIIARKEVQFSDRIKALSRITLKENQLKRMGRKKKQTDDQSKPRINCPKCHDEMMRTFYSLVYLVELDRCTICNLTWFDYDELDMLQCMIDNKLASDLSAKRMHKRQNREAQNTKGQRTRNHRSKGTEAHSIKE